MMSKRAHGTEIVAKDEYSSTWKTDKKSGFEPVKIVEVPIRCLGREQEEELIRASQELWERTVASDKHIEFPPMRDSEERKVLRVKRKHRGDLKCNQWDKFQHYKRWKEEKRRLIEMVENPNSPYALPDALKAHASLTSVETFRKRFEKPILPCVLHGFADEWRAREKWSLASLMENYASAKLKCGEDDEGFSCKLKLKTFLRYQASQRDDSPLYVFDSSYSRHAPEISEDYRIPHVFPEDLFELVGDRRRPPHQWFLVGGERSGTCVHTDPLGTSAWNTLVRGRKLWAMFAPHVPKAVVKGKAYKVRDDEPSDWFCDMLPRILEAEGEEALSARAGTAYLFIQHPGETVFVPHDWHHAVLNLDDTVAVTQNYVGSVNFARSWTITRKERRKMARTWLRRLGEAGREDLVAVAKAIDARDGYNLEEEIERKKEERRRKREKSDENI